MQRLGSSQSGPSLLPNQTEENLLSILSELKPVVVKWPKETLAALWKRRVHSTLMRCMEGMSQQEKQTKCWEELAEVIRPDSENKDENREETEVCFSEFLKSDVEVATAAAIWEKSVVDEVMTTMLLPEESLVLTPAHIEGIVTLAQSMQSWEVKGLPIVQEVAEMFQVLANLANDDASFATGAKVCDFITDAPRVEAASTCLQVLHANLVKTGGWSQKIENYESVLLTEGGVVQQKDTLLRDLATSPKSADVCLRAAILVADSLTRGMVRPKVVGELVVKVTESAESLSKQAGCGGPALMEVCEKMVGSIAKHFPTQQAKLKVVLAHCKTRAVSRKKEEQLEALLGLLSRYATKPEDGCLTEISQALASLPHDALLDGERVRDFMKQAVKAEKPNPLAVARKVLGYCPDRDELLPVVGLSEAAVALMQAQTKWAGGVESAVQEVESAVDRAEEVFCECGSNPHIPPPPKQRECIKNCGRKVSQCLGHLAMEVSSWKYGMLRFTHQWDILERYAASCAGFLLVADHESQEEAVGGEDWCKKCVGVG